MGWTELRLPVSSASASASAPASAGGGPVAEGLYVRPGGTAMVTQGEGGRQGVDFFTTKDQVRQFVTLRGVDFSSTTGHISEGADRVIEPKNKNEWGDDATLDFSQLTAIGWTYKQTRYMSRN